MNQSGRCNPFISPIYCPLLLYILFVLLGLIGILVTYRSTVTPPPPPPSPQQPTTPPAIPSQPLNTVDTELNRLMLVIAVYLIVSYIFGVIIYGFCNQCEHTKSWIVFLLSIILPVLIAMTMGITLRSMM